MSDSNRAKSGLKFRICKCCAKRKRANSVSDAIESYFGKDFTEYEYVIENLAIRPVPKKLLDLVPVHSTTTSRRDDVYDLPCIENPSEPLKKQNTRSVLDWEEDSPPLKILSDDNEDDNKVMISDLDQSLSANPQVSGSNHRKSDTKPEEPPPKICDPPNINKIPTDDSQYPRQVITDLFRASERSLNFKPTSLREKPIPVEIQNTIDALRFKKPTVQFYPAKQEKMVFQSPHLYFSRIDSDVQKAPKFQYRSSTNTFDHLKPSNYKRTSAVDSVVQTEIEESGVSKKNLKWKIIINKHPNAKK